MALHCFNLPTGMFALHANNYGVHVHSHIKMTEMLSFLSLLTLITCLTLIICLSAFDKAQVNNVLHKIQGQILQDFVKR